MITGNFTYTKSYFPCGEMHIQMERIQGDSTYIEFDFTTTEEVIELFLIVDAIRRALPSNPIHLNMAYVPFGRQDRVMKNGESFSLGIFTALINAMKFKTVNIIDPHSDVTTALLDNCNVIKQFQIFLPYFEGKNDFHLISPDGGALKKIYELAARVESSGVIQCTKDRNVKTGEITGTTIHSTSMQGRDCYIVDDICDGGRTFIEIAKELKKLNSGKIILMVTHGFFSKGLEVFDGLIDEIYTRKGRVK
jgi:ribose-phosphate pyrophosphokinase